jgi:hypothetical protein
MRSFRVISGLFWAASGPFQTVSDHFGAVLRSLRAMTRLSQGKFQDHFELFQAGLSHIEAVSCHLRLLDAVVW